MVLIKSLCGTGIQSSAYEMVCGFKINSSNVKTLK